MEDGIRNQDGPVYNIKAVAQLVGLLPVTLRAWERRYGLPVPHRGGQGYRLYSDYDLRTLRWIKDRLESGLSISRAVEFLTELRQAGKDPALEVPLAQSQTSVTIHHLKDQFRRSLEHFDDALAADILRRAFTIYAVETVLMEIIQTTLIELGEAWHAGDLPITVEHFATQFCMQHLNSLLASSAAPTHNGIIVAACAPGENHQIGILSLVVMLRWRGWDVKYLGPDLKLERMEEALIPLHPRVLLFAATLPETARNLAELEGLLSRFPHPRPVLILGGQAFRGMRLAETIPAVYLDASPAAMIAGIEKFLHETRFRE
jgi:MerR family transcriptional regulator, light-induced transcriptional regulator